MKYLFTRASVLLIGIMMIASTASAQFTATGTITDSESVPLIGVSILIKGTTSGTVTDFNGNFEVNVPTDEATLQISYTGFKQKEIQVTRSNPNLTITMDEDVANLEEVIVTGLATTVKRSNLANSVASIGEKELTGTTVQSTMDGALYGKFKGAEIRSSSGAPGGGISVRLRGVTSIFGDQQPLYIVDGVYVDNSTVSLGTNIVTEAAGGGNTSTNQDDASNRIADIDPEDIESVEILKGASAAAIYGSRAAGGVVIINTKRGKQGKTRVSFSQNTGIGRPITLLGTRGWNENKVRTVFNDAEAQRFRENGLNDYEAELYDNTPLLSTTRLSASGGTQKTNFFIGATYKNEDGLVDNTGYEKGSARVNVTHQFADWLEVDLTNNYINSTADRGLFNNGNTNTTIGYALAFTRPWDDLFPDDDGVYPANPRVGSNVLETIALTTNRENVNRYIGGATANIQFFSNNNHVLRGVVRAGLDQYALRTTGIFPRQLTFYRDPSSLSGVSISGSTINTNYNLAAFLIYTYSSDGGITLRTQAGVTQENFDQNTVITTANGLNGSQTNIDQSANVSGFQERRIQQDKGFFIQEEFNWQDRLVATVGLRGDKSSNNGDANQLYYYPKANAAINLHNFDFWTLNTIDNFKLRVAYGESGRFANFDDRFNALEGTLIGGIGGLQTVNLRGNTEVGPERQSELEFGTDIGLLGNRLNIDVTYYIKNIDDLLLRAQIPTSTGYTRQVLNAGELQNKGLEIGIKANPVRGAFNWDFGINWWRNRSEVTRLDVPAFNLGGFAASLGQYRIQQGSSATQIVGTFDNTECANPECLDLDPDGDGFRVYGDAEPDFNMSFTNTLTYKNVELSFLLHWKEGGESINLSTFLYDLAGLTWDYDDTDLDPEGLQTNGQYRLSVNGAGPWVEDNSYIRLREIGLFYRIPKSAFNDVMGLRIGVSARNLINIFDYNSYDPEVSNFGNNVLANTVEVTPYPTMKRYNFHLTATF